MSRAGLSSSRLTPSAPACAMRPIVNRSRKGSEGVGAAWPSLPRRFVAMRRGVHRLLDSQPARTATDGHDTWGSQHEIILHQLPARDANTTGAGVSRLDHFHDGCTAINKAVNVAGSIPTVVVINPSDGVAR